jgi:hypothetical protein
VEGIIGVEVVVDSDKTASGVEEEALLVLDTNVGIILEGISDDNEDEESDKEIVSILPVLLSVAVIVSMFKKLLLLLLLVVVMAVADS